MTVDGKYKHSELTQIIIGVFYDVYNELGFGFVESGYRNAMKFALEEKGLFVQAESPITVFFRRRNVGDFRADLVVNGCVLLELKTADKIIPAYESQTMHYLRGSSLELALILNFGPKPSLKRLILETARINARAQRSRGPS